MKLIVNELKDVAIKQVVIPSRNIIVEAIRPHLYRHKFATGSLKLQILDSLDSIIAESELINISDIGSMDFFHGNVRFFINAYLQEGESYTIQLLGNDGYVFDEMAYCGWVNGHDLGQYPVNGTPMGDFFYPLDLEIWERTAK